MNSPCIVLYLVEIGSVLKCFFLNSFQVFSSLSDLRVHLTLLTWSHTYARFSLIHSKCCPRPKKQISFKQYFKYWKFFANNLILVDRSSFVYSKIDILKLFEENVLKENYKRDIERKTKKN